MDLEVEVVSAGDEVKRPALIACFAELGEARIKDLRECAERRLRMAVGQSYTSKLVHELAASGLVRPGRGNYWVFQSPPRNAELALEFAHSIGAPARLARFLFEAQWPPATFLEAVLLRRYLEWLAEAGRMSAKVARALLELPELWEAGERQIVEFAGWLRRMGYTEGTVRDYVNSLRRGWPPPTMKASHAWRRYLRWLMDEYPGEASRLKVEALLGELPVMPPGRRVEGAGAVTVDGLRAFREELESRGLSAVYAVLVSGGSARALAEASSAWRPWEEAEQPSGPAARLAVNGVYARYYLGARRGRLEVAYIYMPRWAAEEMPVISDYERLKEVLRRTAKKSGLTARRVQLWALDVLSEAARGVGAPRRAVQVVAGRPPRSERELRAADRLYEEHVRRLRENGLL